MEEIKIVFAGNHKQYEDWVKANKLNYSEYCYVESPEGICGLHNIEVFLIGNFWLNRAYQHATNNVLLKTLLK